MSTRLTLLVVILLFLAQTAMFGSVSYLCRMDSKVRSTCCCQNSGQGLPSACSQVKKACCCEIRIEAKVLSPATLSDSTGSLAFVPQLDLPGLVRSEEIRPARQAIVPFDSLPPPGRDRQIHVLTCSFLI